MYKDAFKNYFKTEKHEAVTFIDACIRFMNSIKKMKVEDILSLDNNFDIITDCFINK